jgi:hypothetical protein
MAKQEFFIDLDTDSTDRYDFGKFMRFTDNYDPLTSNFLSSLIKIPPAGVYTVSGELNRPDLLSYRIYGSPKYWWILLAYNRILEFHELIIGQQVQYPSLDSLEDLYFSLKAKESANQ